MDLLAQQYWLPPDISTHGDGVDLLIRFLHVFMIVLFVAWGVFFVYCLVRFRRRDGQAAMYQPIKAKASKYAEIMVVVVEAILLIGFSMPVWARTKKAERFPDPAEALEVRVVGQQFAWNIHYPGADGTFGPRDLKLVDEALNPLGLDRAHPDAKDDIVSVNQMHVPVNKPVIVRLSSKDVIHSFWIPMLRVKQDTIPGMSIPIWFEATQTTEDMRSSLAHTVAVPAEGADTQRFLQRNRNHILTRDYGDAAGGTLINEEVLGSLRQAGVEQIEITPNDPIEIHCAQLCGLNHYSMRGFLTVETEEQFAAWLDQQAMYLDTGDDWDDWGDEEDEE